MNLIITLLFIYAVALAAIILNKISGRNLICPICAGVSATWVWMLAVRFLGYPMDTAIVGVLMGGSVVGIAYQIDKRLVDSTKSVIFKMLFIPVGFSAVYAVLSFWWGIAGIALLCATAIALIFGLGSRINKTESGGRASELEAKMEKCC